MEAHEHMILTGPVHGGLGAVLPRTKPRAFDSNAFESALAEVDRVAAQLFAESDPTSAAGQLLQRLEPIENFYAPNVINEIAERMAVTVTNGSRLYLRGMGHAVGTTTLALDFARAYNVKRAQQKDPRRLLYVSVPTDTQSLSRFLDEIAERVQAPLSAGDLRVRGRGRLIRRLVTAMREQRIVGLVLDHVHNMHARVRPALADLLRATDPMASFAPIDLDDYGRYSAERLAVIVVTHQSPGKLMGAQPDVLHLLDNNYVELHAYTAESTRDAMRAAGVGLPSDPGEERAMAYRIHGLTDGKPAGMRRLFELVKTYTQGAGEPPSMAAIEFAMEYYRVLAGAHTTDERDHAEVDETGDEAAGPTGARDDGPKPRAKVSARTAQRNDELKRLGDETHARKKIQKVALGRATRGKRS
jgi:hypothetical protein